MMFIRQLPVVTKDIHCIRKQKSSKLYSTSNFAVIKQLPGSYLLLPKRYKEIKFIEIIFKIKFQSDQAVTRQLPAVTKEI